MIVTLESQLQALKKQARQANRYRTLNDHIRRAEALLIHLNWQEALRQIENSVLEDQAVDHLLERAKVTEQPASFREIMNFGA